MSSTWHKKWLNKLFSAKKEKNLENHATYLALKKIMDTKKSHTKKFNKIPPLKLCASHKPFLTPPDSNKSQILKTFFFKFFMCQSSLAIQNYDSQSEDDH